MKDELVAAVKKYAIEHYEQGGWDTIVECHSDAEIAEAIGNASTVRGAIFKVKKTFAIKEYDSYRRDIQAEAF